MADNTHRIMRQILELDFGPTDQFAELQQVAARVLQNQGLTTMATVFDHLAGAEQWIRLERLEIDLGVLRGADWPEQFNQRLAEQLEHRLVEALTKQQSAPSATVSATDKLFEQFLYLCQWGRLPWWGNRVTADWLEQLLTTLTSAQWHLLVEQLKCDRRMRQRLIYTVDDNFLQTLLQRFSQLPAAAHVQQQLRVATWSATTQTRWRERFWSTVLTHSPVSTVAAGVGLMQQLLAIRQQLVTTNLTGRLETDVVPPSNRQQPPIVTDLASLPAPWRSWLRPLVHTVAPFTPSANKPVLTDERAPTAAADLGEFSLNEALGAEPKDTAAPIQSSPQADAASATPDSSSPQADQPESALVFPLTNSSFSGLPDPDRESPALEEIVPHTWSVPEAVKEVYVDAAGLVILHPFLQELFNSLELLDGHQFCNGFTQRRAVALLTYLAFGDICAQEYELLLPKLLAQWPWAEPLPPYDLSEVDRRVCDQLMAAVLEHWSALRSNSAPWLRETFFWRDGKLTPVDGGWQLTIERHAQDVLLNRLPWGLGVIRLPWMTDFLYVSWIS